MNMEIDIIFLNINLKVFIFQPKKNECDNKLIAVSRYIKYMKRRNFCFYISLHDNKLFSLTKFLNF